MSVCEEKPCLGNVRLIKDQFVRIAAVYWDDEGQIVSVQGDLLEGNGKGERQYVAIDMRGIPWPDAPVWLM